MIRFSVFPFKKRKSSDKILTLKPLRTLIISASITSSPSSAFKHYPYASLQLNQVSPTSDIHFFSRISAKEIRKLCPIKEEILPTSQDLQRALSTLTGKTPTTKQALYLNRNWWRIPVRQVNAKPLSGLQIAQLRKHYKQQDEDPTIEELQEFIKKIFNKEVPIKGLRELSGSWGIPLHQDQPIAKEVEEKLQLAKIQDVAQLQLFLQQNTRQKFSQETLSAVLALSRLKNAS